MRSRADPPGPQCSVVGRWFHRLSGKARFILPEEVSGNARLFLLGTLFQNPKAIYRTATTIQDAELSQLTKRRDPQLARAVPFTVSSDGIIAVPGHLLVVRALRHLSPLLSLTYAGGGPVANLFYQSNSFLDNKFFILLQACSPETRE